MVVSLGSFRLAGLTESPLHGFAEQFSAVANFGLEDPQGEICEDAEENSAAVKEVLACLSTMRSVGMLRNLVANCTIFFDPQ